MMSPSSGFPIVASFLIYSLDSQNIHFFIYIQKIYLFLLREKSSVLYIFDS